MAMESVLVVLTKSQALIICEPTVVAHVGTLAFMKSPPTNFEE
jgi:hypothetical protein